MKRSTLAGKVTVLPASSVICLVSFVSVVGGGCWAEQANRISAQRLKVAIASGFKYGRVEVAINKNPADLCFLAGEQTVGGTQLKWSRNPCGLNTHTRGVQKAAK